MKHYLQWIAIVLVAGILTGCLYQTSNKPAAGFTTETWQRQVTTNPEGWARGASPWFTRGESQTVTQMNADAPVSAAMTTMMIKVPNSFTNIKVAGNYRVEIFGTNEANTVYVYGPNAATREVRVRVTDNTLYLEQSDAAPKLMGTIVVRVGVRDLRSLIQIGSGQIEGRYVHSNNLTVISSGPGNIYLGGLFNLSRVDSKGCGNISLFGAVTPSLDINTYGSGSVNVSGNVGVHKITHHGVGNINIIGANSNNLVIKADGKGKIGINGRAAVCEIDASDKVCVFVYYVSGDTMNIYATDYAHVGVAGCVRVLNVDAGRASRVDGHYLYATDAYVRAHDAAHINVTATNKVFAASTGNSSIYLFSTPAVLTQFYRDHGVILPILTRGHYACGYCPYFKSARIYKD